MTALDRAIEAFAAAHAAELDADEQFTLGRAAGIVRRVHQSVRFPLPAEMTAADILDLGRESLRRNHPTLAAEYDAELDAERGGRPCPDCGHVHAGPAFGSICIGCDCLSVPAGG